MSTAISERESAIPAPLEPGEVKPSATVAQSLNQAESALAAGDVSLAIEAIALAAIRDIQQDNTAFLVGAAEAAYITDWYEKCFKAADLQVGLARQAGNPPYRLGFVIFSLAMGQAASYRLTRMVELIDREKFLPQVIVADELTRRSPPGRLLKVADTPSRLAGAELHDRLRSQGIPIHYIPLHGDHLIAIADGTDKLRELDLDIAVFIGSAACPISAGLAYRRVAPVQLNQNIGVPLPITGMDGITYHNTWTAQRDEPELARRGIVTLPLRSAGTDVTLADESPTVPRARMGVPDDAVVLMCAGNKLTYRLPAGDFLNHLGDFLAKHPKAYFMAMGRGELNQTLEPLKQRGLGDRCITVGPTSNIRPVLKAVDIFLNEYPEGGCNTVMEAMACGTPAMAMHAGAQHTHNHGAMLLGDPWAVMAYDPATYWQRVGQWVEDANARKQAGQAQREKCIATYDYPILCREYEEKYMEMLHRV